jgi:Flp pilus assembly protein TadG
VARIDLTSARVGERGAAAVEFALVVGLLLTVVFGITGFGKAYSEVVALTGAAREGARRAAVRAAPSEVTNAVHDAAAPYEVNGSISVSTQCDEDNQGEPVTVSWTEPIEIDLVLLGTLSKTREIAAVFRCE